MSPQLYERSTPPIFAVARKPSYAPKPGKPAYAPSKPSYAPSKPTKKKPAPKKPAPKKKK